MNTISVVYLIWCFLVLGLGFYAFGGLKNLQKLEANLKAVSEPFAANLVKRLHKATGVLIKKTDSSFNYYESVKITEQFNFKIYL